jgi:hypothetical protein
MGREEGIEGAQVRPLEDPTPSRTCPGPVLEAIKTIAR